MNRLKADTRRTKFGVLTIKGAHRARGALVAIFMLGACGFGASDNLTAGESSPAGPTVTSTFEPSTFNFVNPERGFVGNVGDISKTSEEQLAAEAKAEFSMIRSYVRLDDFVEQDLSQEFLETLATGLDMVAASGLKVIIRFTYDPEDASLAERGVDASIEQAETHIQQLSPVFKQHQDVIAFVEAGFIGAYGEWHSSVSGLDETVNRLRIKDALMRSVPAQQFVLFRDPADHHRWFSGASPEKSGSHKTDVDRAGFHNDCFLTGATDGNTYPKSKPGLRDLVRQRAQFVPFGGETCQLPEPRSSCGAILSAGSEYSVSYLNWYFYRPVFHDVWQAQGCLDEIRRSLGYRFELSSISHSAKVHSGNGFSIELKLRNIGWARLYRSRPLVAHLIRNDGSVAFSTVVADVDPSEWEPLARAGEPNLTSNGTVNIPSDVPAGTYRLALSLPDSSSRLAENPRYSIRFANANRAEVGQVWDVSKGWLKTGTAVQVYDSPLPSSE